MTDIALRPVFSSHIDRIGYDEDTKELHVAFQGSRNRPPRIAVYHGVPYDLAHGVLNAPSIGMAMHRSIRGRFAFTYKASP